MKMYNLPYFGEVPHNVLENEYNVKIDYKGKEKGLIIYINLENRAIDEYTEGRMTWFLENISALDSENRLHIQGDLDNGGETAAHIKFYTEGLPAEKLAAIININDNLRPRELQLLDKLELSWVYLVPSREDYFITFSYVIAEGEYNDNFLAVLRTKSGELFGILEKE